MLDELYSQLKEFGYYTGDDTKNGVKIEYYKINGLSAEVMFDINNVVIMVTYSK